ncbi:ribonuclease III, partial [Brasilonema sp. CT11]|nr:ribonuclease III [Brasilonema sp. CT11]
MAVTNHEQVSRSLTLLNQGLYPYVKREMQKVYGERWLRIISSSMSDNSPIKLNPEEILGNDVFTLLKVIIGQWNQVFSKNLGYAEGSLVSELMEFSISWADQYDFST